MKSLKLVIAGSSGRMGQSLIQAIETKAPTVSLHAALDRRDSPAMGRDVGQAQGLSTGVFVTDDLPAALTGADVLIDFTRPEATLQLLPACIHHGVKLVIGTTGFDAAGKRAIEEAAEQTGIVFAPNFSVGVNLSFKLIDLASRVLDDDYDIEIIEAHHRHKVDAPSGTALRMGEIVATAMGRDLAECAVYGREGITGEREARSIGFSTIRAGDIVGEHTVMFATAGERVEISHKASSRATFAHGAIRAARWLADKPSGLFSMQDVLGLN